MRHEASKQEKNVAEHAQIVIFLVVIVITTFTFVALHKARSCKDSQHKNPPIHHRLVKDPGEIKSTL